MSRMVHKAWRKDVNFYEAEQYLEHEPLPSGCRRNQDDMVFYDNGFDYPIFLQHSDWIVRDEAGTVRMYTDAQFHHEFNYFTPREPSRLP